MRSTYHASCVCILALASAALAAPPSLDIPAEVRPVQGYARVTPKTDAVSVTYVSLDGLYPFPSEELKDPRRFVLPVAGVKAGRYRYVAVAASKTGEQTTREFVVVTGDAQPDPPRPDPPKPDPQPEPPKPDPAKVDSVFVVVVEDAHAPRTVETARALNDAWWSTLKPKHDYRHYLSKSQESIDAGYTRTAQSYGYPAVLVLSREGKVLRAAKLSGIELVKALVSEVAK